MTKDEAQALADKRNAHKGKSLSNKEWIAVEENSEWGVKLVDSKAFMVAQAKKDAREAVLDGRAALSAGDLNGFVDAAGRHLLAQIKIDLSQD